jgi:CubicO group peptidase (beta-lactamase class C family)
VTDPLTAIDDWPVTTGAAAVIGAGGVLAARGPGGERFPLASLTKPLAVLAALVAVEEDAVALDAPVLPDVVPDATLRHVMSHASGLAPDRRSRAAAPGTRRIYSNVGIEVMGECVERASGIEFGDYVHQAVFEPLGMTGSLLAGSPARDGISTVDDFSALLTSLVAGPSGWLHPSTIKEATTVQFPGLRGVVPGYGKQDPNDWGLGFEIRSAKSPHWTGSTNSPATYGHFGQAGTMFWVDPTAELGLVALTDRDFGPWAAEAWPRLSDAILARYA